MAEPLPLELERGPPPLRVRRRRTPCASRDRGEPLDELVPARRGALGRGGRGRRSLVRREVRDRHVRLVPDAGDDRNGAGVHGPGYPLLVERPEVLEGAAAPHHEEDVALRAAHRDADRVRDLLSRAFPLDPGRVDHHRQRGEPASQHLEHVVHRRAARRGDHPELARKGWRGALVLCIEESLLLELAAQALVGEPERAFARRLELLHHELVVPARAVQAHPGAGDHLHPVPRLEPEPHPARAEERAAHLGAGVLQGEVHVPRAGPREVGELAFHPDEGEGVLEQARDLVVEAPDGVDLAVRRGAGPGPGSDPGSGLRSGGRRPSGAGQREVAVEGRVHGRRSCGRSHRPSGRGARRARHRPSKRAGAAGLG